MVRDTDKHICFFFWNSLLFLLFSPTCYYFVHFFCRFRVFLRHSYLLQTIYTGYIIKSSLN